MHLGPADQSALAYVVVHVAHVTLQNLTCTARRYRERQCLARPRQPRPVQRGPFPSPPHRKPQQYRPQRSACAAEWGTGKGKRTAGDRDEGGQSNDAEHHHRIARELREQLVSSRRLRNRTRAFPLRT